MKDSLLKYLIFFCTLVLFGLLINASELKKWFLPVLEKKKDILYVDSTVKAQKSNNNKSCYNKSEDKVAPHGECNSCHMNHNAVGAQLGMINGNANLCMSCHNPSGAASTMPFTDAMKAIPGTSGNSHAWNKLSVNGSYETNLTTDAEMLLRVVNDSIMCSTCHNQHSQTFSPFLRSSNSGDALCKNCHSTRNILRFSDNPSNKGSHPVGLTYPVADSRFNATPSDPNILVVNSNVECTSCHSVHNAATSDGYLLRATNNDNLCTSCHTYGQHNGMGCTICHDNHNTDKTNIYMIRNTITTPNSGNKSVLFTAETGANSFADGDATYNGVCEVCHTTTTYHRNTVAGDHAHNVGLKCVDCHPHSNNFTPAACHSCHDTSLPNEYPATGAHAKHAGPPYNFKCNTCHNNYGNGGSSEPSHPSGSANVVFNPNGMAKRNGLDTNTPSWDSGAKTCNNVYCHSHGYSAQGTSMGVNTHGNWEIAGTVPRTASANVYLTTPSWYSAGSIVCGDCHLATAAGNGTGATDRPTSGRHQGAAAHQTWCYWCHNTDGTTTFMGTYGTSQHIDGTVGFNPARYSNGGTMSNSTTNASDSHCGKIGGGGKTCWY